MHIQELARTLGAEVDAEADFEVTGLRAIGEAGPTDVTFLANMKYVRALEESKAGAILVDPGFDKEIGPVPLRIANPYLAFAKALELFHTPPTVPKGVHPTAVLGEGVQLGEDVAIGPYVVLGDRVRIGDGVMIFPHVVVYEHAQIGPGSVLHSFSVVREHVRLGGGVILQNGAVVGADGFGFAPRADRSFHKIPQAGTVIVGDDVEIQANACVDRASVGASTVDRGAKIDNLVQVGHGCHIGEDTLLCGQVGLAGSADVGNRVVLGGQAGVNGHCRIDDDVRVAGQSGVGWRLKGPAEYGGLPAMDIKAFRAWMILQPKTQALYKRVKTLEKKLAALEEGKEA